MRSALCILDEFTGILGAESFPLTPLVIDRILHTMCLEESIPDNIPPSHYIWWHLAAQPAVSSDDDGTSVEDEDDSSVEEDRSDEDGLTVTEADVGNASEAESASSTLTGGSEAGSGTPDVSEEDDRASPCSVEP